MSSSFGTADLETRIRALDVQSALPGVGLLRSWVLEALAVRPGERAVDVGSGTGSHAGELASVGAQAIGVEPDGGMRVTGAGRQPGVAFVGGSAYALPFADGSVDVVTCERVFQHLDSPSVAAAEIARVLRAGEWRSRTPTGRRRSCTPATRTWSARSAP